MTGDDIFLDWTLHTLHAHRQSASGMACYFLGRLSSSLFLFSLFRFLATPGNGVELAGLGTWPKSPLADHRGGGLSCFSPARLNLSIGQMQPAAVAHVASKGVA